VSARNFSTKFITILTGRRVSKKSTSTRLNVLSCWL
jgi:hypothetical protein